MKIRARRISALLLAVALMSASGHSAVYTTAFGDESELSASSEETPGETLEESEEPAKEEEPEQEETPAPETSAPETAAPETTAPETAAPETTAPETAAPETSAPETTASETNAPETTASETAASETNAQSESSASSTEASTQKETEKESSKQTETEDEDEDDEEEEGKSRTFEASVSKGTIRIKLPKGKGVVESSELICDAETYEDDDYSRAKVDKAVLGKQRVITGGRFYTICLDTGEDVIDLPEGTKVTFERSEAMDLGLKPQLQAKTHIYNISSDSAQEISADIPVDQNLNVTGFSFTVPGKMSDFALIAEENRANDGAAVSRGDVVASIGDAGDYAAVAESVEGKVQGKSISNSTELLDQLAGYSVTLANAQSGSDATVVNVYTNSDGTVMTDASDAQDPMRAVLNAAGQIDVSGGRMVVVNYVVTNPDTGHVSLPRYDVVSDGQAIDKHSIPEQGGRFVVTVTTIAQGTDSNYQLTPYTGSIGIGSRSVGTYLVPNGSISTDGRLVGAAYARSVSVGDGKKIIKATVKAEYGGGEEETKESSTEETETEDETEAETETDAETESETAAEAETGLELKAAPKAKALLKAVKETEEESGEKAETALLSAADVDEGDENFTIGGLDEGSVIVKKTDSVNGTNVTGATLTLYSVSAITYAYERGSTKYSNTIPANYALASHTFGTGEGQDEWDISEYIKKEALNSGGTTTPLTTIYTIKETAAASGHVKAWDFTFTCTGNASGYTITKNVSGGTDVDPSRVVDASGVASTSGTVTPCEIHIVDKATSGLQTAAFDVVDADNTSTRLSGVRISVREVKVNGENVSGQPTLAEFTSANSVSTIDLSELAAMVPAPEAGSQQSITFAFREEAEAPTYAFVQNTIAGVTPSPFTREVQITITKTRPGGSGGAVTTAYSGLPAGTDKTIHFKQQKIWFLVEARYTKSTGEYIPNVKFQLKAGSDVFKRTADGKEQYKIYVNNQAVTGEAASTRNTAMIIKLTEAGKTALAGKELKVSWTGIPYGYVYKDTHADVTVYKGSTLYDARVILDPKTIEVAAGVSGKTPYLAGATFNLTASEKVLSGTTSAGAFKKVKLTKKQADAVSSKGSYTITAAKAPFGYTISGSVQTVTKDTVEKGGQYVIPLKERDRGSAVVTKETRVKSLDGDPYYIPETVEGTNKKRRIPKAYYVTAFTDAALTAPATDADGNVISGEIDVPYAWYYSNIKSNKGSRTAVLEGLYVGETYYLAETTALVTDADDFTLLEPSSENGIKAVYFTPKGSSASKDKGAVKVTSAKSAKSVKMTNVYSERGLARATYRIKVNVVDSDNKPVSKVLNASFQIWAEDKTHWGSLISVPLSNTSTATKEGNSYRWNASDYNLFRLWGEMVSLTDSSGANVMAKYDLVDPDDGYKVLASGTKIRSYTRSKKHIYIRIKPDESNKRTLEYTLREKKTEKEIAELKLTKAVTYKKTPIRVNGTYYIGIFEDAAHKKILYKKAMSLANASSMTSTLRINLYKLASPHTITLYFAETDKNGKVVSSGSKSGYDISINKTSVTLSPTNADETIVVTNNVRDGSVAAANLTNPSSGFAGDTSALAEAQALSNGEATASKPTGDDTPYEPFALATGISAAMIFLLLAMLMAKKKLWPGQRTK